MLQPRRCWGRTASCVSCWSACGLWSRRRSEDGGVQGISRIVEQMVQAKDAGAKGDECGRKKERRWCREGGRDGLDDPGGLGFRFALFICGTRSLLTFCLERRPFEEVRTLGSLKTALAGMGIILRLSPETYRKSSLLHLFRGAAAVLLGLQGGGRLRQDWSVCWLLFVNASTNRA